MIKLCKEQLLRVRRLTKYCKIEQVLELRAPFPGRQ